MHLKNRLTFALAIGCFSFAHTQPASALCTLPYLLTNGQTADATQVMANLQALANCLAAAPSGATNAVQYNAGSGAFGAVGPLTDGQVVIGSTGGAPQAQTLTAGSGVTITNAPGSITIASAGGAGGAGLYRQVMSPTPTSTSTGLTNWLNQGSAVLTESAVGVSIRSPSSGGNVSLAVRYMAAPTPPYAITALISATRDSNTFSGVGIGWYDGSSKLHVLSSVTNSGTAPFFEVERLNSATSWSGNDFATNKNGFSQPFWAQIRDDGVNVTFAYSQDGANFLDLFTTTKSAGFLGATGYSNVAFFVSPQGGPTIGTLMSWAQN